MAAFVLLVFLRVCGPRQKREDPQFELHGWRRHYTGLYRSIGGPGSPVCIYIWFWTLYTIQNKPFFFFFNWEKINIFQLFVCASGRRRRIQSTLLRQLFSFLSGWFDSLTAICPLCPGDIAYSGACWARTARGRWKTSVLGVLHWACWGLRFYQSWLLGTLTKLLDLWNIMKLQRKTKETCKLKSISGEQAQHNDSK